MRPVKRRRGWSAMRVLINDKPADALTPKQEASFMLSKVQQDVKSTVLAPADATQAYIAQTKRWFLILGSIALVVMLAFAIVSLVADPTDGGFVAVGADIFAWPLLVIDQVELTRSTASTGETSTVIHVVERLSLLAGTKAIVLDRAMLQNGLLLVDNVWRRLRAPTP